jgi:predicted alpha/beta-hydrolase family hydrolase
MMARRAEVSGNYIVVDCPPEEMEQYHLPDLKGDVVTTNGKYEEFLHRQEANAKRLADEQSAEKERLEKIKARLSFD